MPGSKGAKILIIDDEPDLRSTLTRFLDLEGFAVTQTETGGDLARHLNGGVSVVILDINLPGEGGFEIARRLRAGWPNVGLIMLSVRTDLVDKVVGLEIGADDYIAKPFEPRELLARVRAVLRRAQPFVKTPEEREDLRVFDGWTLDLTRRKLFAPDGVEVGLTTTEFSILKALASQPGEPVSRQALYELVRLREWSPLERSLDTHIANLRRKLGNSSDSRRGLITTVHGVGYVFASAVSGDQDTGSDAATQSDASRP